MGYLATGLLMAEFAFIGPAYAARSPNFDAQRCINLYPELSGDGTSKSVAMLVGTPGLLLWSALSGAGVRGLFPFSSTILIAIAGTTAYKIDMFGNAMPIGTISGNTLVSMESNGSVVMCSIGTGPAYFINPIAMSITPATGGFIAAGKIGFIDGYFIWNVPGTQQFQFSQIFGTAIDALDFASAEGSPDLLISLIDDHREVWLFGENSTEVFFNSGNNDNPFERIQGAFIETGCAAANSPAKLDNSVVWLAKDKRGRGIVQRAAGYVPQIISTRAVEYAIGQYPRIDDAIGFSYTQEGHAFYVLVFPSANATWCYDASTHMWHERAWGNPAASLKRIRANCQVEFAGKTLVGDWENGNIYQLDLDTYTDNGAALVRLRQAQHLNSGYNFQFFSRLQVDMETGVGIPAGQGSDPQASLSWSDDGGHTWSNEMFSRLGKIGEYKARAIWRRLGKARDRIFRVAVSDPVKVIMIGASVDATVGNS